MKNRTGSNHDTTVMAGILSLVLGMVLVACGGGATGPDAATSHNNPGTGTSNFMVIVDIDARDDANMIGGFFTNYTVSVKDGLGNPVESVTVTIQNATLGTVTLPQSQPGSSDYQLLGGTFPAGDFRLDVVKGANNLHGVVVGGPMVHAILAPHMHDTVRADSAMTVRWTTPMVAKSARVETQDFSQEVADNGTFQIPGVENPARAEQRLRIYRYNEVDIAGGLSGSRMRVSVRKTLEPYVVR